MRTFSLSFPLSISKVSSVLLKSICAAVVAFSVLTTPAAIAAKSDSKQPIAHVKVNINSANAELLASSLTGVGIKKAQAIVDWRKKNGKFKSLSGLTAVKGIGEATIEKNRAKLTL